MTNILNSIVNLIENNILNIQNPNNPAKLLNAVLIEYYFK